MNITVIYYPLIVIILGRILLPLLVFDRGSAFFSIAIFTGILLFGTAILWTFPLIKNLPIWLKIVAIIGELFFLFFIFIYCFLLAYIFEPWPISSIQGPNTFYAWHAYKSSEGSKSRTEVTNVYFHSRWQGWGDGSGRILRFDCKDKIAFAKKLLNQPKASLQNISLPDVPGWWPHESQLLIKIDPPARNKLTQKESQSNATNNSAKSEWPSPPNTNGRWVESNTCRTYIISGRWYG